MERTWNFDPIFDLWTQSMTLTSDQCGQMLSSAHRLNEIHMHAKYEWNPSKRSEDMEQTRNFDPIFDIWTPSMTLTLNRRGQMLRSANRLNEIHMHANYEWNPSRRSEDMERTRNFDPIFDLWTPSMTLTLNRRGQMLRSAHRLNEIHIHEKNMSEIRKGVRRYGADTKSLTDGQMDWRTDGLKDGWTDGWTMRLLYAPEVPSGA